MILGNVLEAFGSYDDANAIAKREMRKAFHKRYWVDQMTEFGFLFAADEASAISDRVPRLREWLNPEVLIARRESLSACPAPAPRFLPGFQEHLDLNA